jgi:hypothetical protein
LQRELDQFVETDDIVRRNLDRKDHVYQIRSKVDTAINASQHMIVPGSKSPYGEYSPARKVEIRETHSRSPLGNARTRVEETRFGGGMPPVKRVTYHNRDYSPAK